MFNARLNSPSPGFVEGDVFTLLLDTPPIRGNYSERKDAVQDVVDNVYLFILRCPCM